MSIRNYAGHHENCAVFKMTETPTETCTCGLDKAITAHDKREQAIDAIITECERIVNLDPVLCETLDGLLRKLEDGR